MLKVSSSTIYALIKEDANFPFANVGLKKRYFINAHELMKWLKRRTNKHRSDEKGLPTIESLLKLTQKEVK